jgi:hypothetical protein
MNHFCDLFEKFKGISELYEQQKQKYASLQGIDDETTVLIDLINTEKKGIEQESFIL